MARDETVRERDSEQPVSDDEVSGGAEDESNDSSKLLNRRSYVKLAGAAAATVGGLGASSLSASAVSEGGPSNTADWTLAFEDTFDSGSLDTSKWGIGFGWGRTTTGSPERIVDQNVEVRNGQLHLKGTHDGSDYMAGGVHTRNKAYFGPGTYWEAKLKMPKRVGFLPAFWGKPNSEAWPPEIDFVELFQTGRGYEDTHVSNHHIHYSSSTTPGDGSTHQDSGASYDAGVDLTSDFHIYGCKWMQDKIVHYVDGVKVAERTDPTIMESVNNGAPFYMMLNIHIDRIGTADASESWGEELVADWVRVWEHAPDSGSTDDSGSSTDGSDSTTDSGTDRYLWVRSADGSDVTYAFEASGGNIRHDSNEHSGDASADWIASDGMTAGGTATEGGLSGDGFWFQGEIADLKYSGPIETYVDDQYVDPDSLVDSSKPGPAKPSDSTDSTDSTSSLPHTLTIDGRNGSDPVSYSVSVTEDVEAVGSLDSEDAISGNTVEGTVAGGTDEYAFSGGLSNIQLDGDAAVFVDGNRVDLLRVKRAPESSGGVTYLVETDGSLIKADVPSASINEHDRVENGKVLGKVYAGTDAYWVINGNVTDVSAFYGDVATVVNGTETDLSN